MNPWFSILLIFCGTVFAAYMTMVFADEVRERRARRRRSPFGPVQKWGGRRD